MFQNVLETMPPSIWGPSSTAGLGVRRLRGVRMLHAHRAAVGHTEVLLVELHVCLTRSEPQNHEGWRLMEVVGGVVDPRWRSKMRKLTRIQSHKPLGHQVFKWGSTWLE